MESLEVLGRQQVNEVPGKWGLMRNLNYTVIRKCNSRAANVGKE
jgi:hypothetical protein